MAVMMGAVGARAAALDVPLALRETDGEARVENPVNSGVPLPKGAVMDASRLRLLDAKGNAVLASIEPRCRWLGDESLKWVTVHFLASVAAKREQRYVLTDRPGSRPASPLTVEEQGKTIVVVTGPARFVVPTDRLAPLAQVSLRADASKAFTDADALLAAPAVVRLVGRNGEMRVVDRKAELVGLEDRFEQTAVVQGAQVEERGPGRAVVALVGTFSTPKAESLDFTARLYFYAGAPLAQMTLSVRNRQLKTMSRFVAIDRLAVEVPLKTGERVEYALSLDGRAVEGRVGESPVTLLQTARNKAVIDQGAGRRVTGEKSPGWVRVTTGRTVLTAGNRWFWQTYPKGVAVGPDGRVALDLAPLAGERIDLFTAGAKTHFLFFHFAASGEAAPASLAAGTTHPLVTQCEPAWYCEQSRVFGDLYSNRPENFQPEYRDLIDKYQKNIDRCVQQIVAQRPREDWSATVDEYGWLDFGSGLHDRRYVGATSALSWWDGNYYDFPHAVIINYARTGGLLSLRTAEEAGLHLADIDICHSFPGDPKQAGSPRSGPVLGHFRDYTRDQDYVGHNSFTFYKNESLYELYYLTGERWYHDVGLMSSEFAMNRWGQGALRNVAHGIWGVLSAYHDTHQQRYLDRARFFVDKWAKPWQDKYQGSFNDQLWLYGLQFEAYDKYYRVTGDVETARYNVKAIDAAMREEVGDGQWKNTGARSGICLAGYGIAYGYTGEQRYLDYGLEVLERTSRADPSRVKTFAQQFRASPYFLTCLTVGYKPAAFLAAK